MRPMDVLGWWERELLEHPPAREVNRFAPTLGYVSSMCGTRCTQVLLPLSGGVPRRVRKVRLCCVLRRALLLVLVIVRSLQRS